jgi:hypothetical protein
MASDDHDPSRRLLMGGMASGVAAALAAGPALAQSAAPVSGGGTAAQPLVDPTTKYPKPPFPRQEQPWPGLASRMDPRAARHS